MNSAGTTTLSHSAGVNVAVTTPATSHTMNSTSLTVYLLTESVFMTQGIGSDWVQIDLP